MKHRITIVFETDRELTPDEVDDIIVACVAQVEEPQTRTDDGQQDMDVRVLQVWESYKNELADGWAGVGEELL
jgi:hypothetical protein